MEVYENAIELKGVTKKYDGFSLKEISFNVPKGCIMGFIGQNGAGKTTTIKSIVGILDFDCGNILINGKSIKDDAINAKKEIAYVPDNPDLYENMKAIEYINFICDMYEISKEERFKNIQKYSIMFEIDDKLND